MVATRRGAKTAPEVEPAPSNTLNAPPKRGGGRKKAVVEEAAEPAPAITKPTKATATKRKAKAEPEDSEPPLAKKTTANTKATRAAKVETKAEPAPAAAKRATRGRKAVEPAVVAEPEVVEEPEVIEEAPKPAVTRTRKAPAKKAPAPKVEEPVAVEEPVVEEATKPASRSRKAPAKKAIVTKKAAVPAVEEPVVEEQVVEKPIEAEPVKPAPRTRKVAAPKLTAVAPVIASRATRGRNAPTVPQESPLKAPARKPTKKAAAPVAAAKAEPKPIEEPFTQFPAYPTTPAHVAAHFTSKRAMRELPQYPNTPAHIQAPLSTKDALTALPDYPKTPAHIQAPISNKAAFAEMPEYPKTPAHIKAPISVQEAMAEMPDYPNTPAHIVAPVASIEPMATICEDILDENVESQDAVNEVVESEVTGHEIVEHEEIEQEILELKEIEEKIVEHEVEHELVEHEVECEISEHEDILNEAAEEVVILNEENADEDAMAEEVVDEDAMDLDILDILSETPQTPAHVEASMVSSEAPEEQYEAPGTPVQTTASSPAYIIDEVVVTQPSTPVQIMSTGMEVEIQALETLNVNVSTPQTGSGEASTIEEPSTPTQVSSPLTEGAFDASNTPQMPSNLVWGVTDQEAFGELPAGYPATPAHIKAPFSTKEALNELPDYPKTPAHIQAPLTPRRALAELPSYPTTPALVIEAAIQAEITASVKKQTPSPLKFPGLDDVSFQFAETSYVTDVDMTEVEIETPAQPAPKLHLAPLQLTANISAPEPASPIKSALRSPQKMAAKTPKKAVTWDDPEESDLFLFDGPLQGMTFYVDVTRNGKDQSFLFSGLLEDLGAKIVKEWVNTGLSHVLYKDGSQTTLEKVVASKGAIKCVNVGWVLDSEKHRMRMDETPYLVDLSTAMPASPIAKATLKPFTPARTPSKYALPPSSECKSLPSTPTSSEFDRSINFDDDKENSEHGIFFDNFQIHDGKLEARTVPPKKSSFLFSRSPIKTPSQPKFLLNTPVKSQSVMKPFLTGKKSSLADSSAFPGIKMGPPKKFRLF